MDSAKKCDHPEHWYVDFGKRDTRFEILIEMSRWFWYRHEKVMPKTDLITWTPDHVRTAMEVVYWEVLFQAESRKIGEAKKKTLIEEVIKPLVEEFMQSHKSLMAELEVTHG